MMETLIVDGKKLADSIMEQVSAATQDYIRKINAPPCLAVILVGNAPASSVYVRNKAISANKVGFRSLQKNLPETISEDELIVLIKELNEDPAINGILLQLPLPAHINPSRLIELIMPAKDVDAFHPLNVGRLVTGASEGTLLPCTPAGCLEIIRSLHGNDLAGFHAVIVGRSNIVGKPAAHLLLSHDCTVTIAHSRTKDLSELTRTADILIAAVGCPGIIKKHMIKPGATVIDVGINRMNDTNAHLHSPKLVGDVDFDGAIGIAGAITPVPGGVGPMTIAMLLRNTLLAAAYQNNLTLSA